MLAERGVHRKIKGAQGVALVLDWARVRNRGGSYRIVYAQGRTDRSQWEIIMRWLALVLLLLSVGCSPSSAPDCDDGDVEDLVFEISEREIAKARFPLKGGFNPQRIEIAVLATQSGSDAVKQMANDVLEEINSLDH